jgi:hypothetical protein
MTTSFITDITAFADPGTTPSVRETKSKIQIQLVRFGDDHEYLIDTSAGKIEGRHNNSKFSSIKALLASESFADIRRFAQTQRQVLSQKNLTSLIPPSGIINPETNPQDLSIELVREIIAPVTQSSLQIILLDGPAGVGKTSLIERMVYERSLDFSVPPIFHITSKGRRLSNLPDAIGKTASDLNARFRTEHVSILARHNILQVAIDGFDELVQPDGYGGAWEALKDFIRQVKSNGPLILAGRDTFFDQQGVTKKLGGQPVDLRSIRLNEVDFSAAKSWLINNGWDESQFENQDAIEFFSREYIRRPFFIAQICGFSNFSSIPTELGSPQTILVDRLLERESRIIQPVLKSMTHEQIKSALSNVFEEISIDMADRETDSVPVSYIEFVCDVVLEDLASPDERNALTKKIGSAPLLENSGINGECKFPHSEIQNHFVAKAMIAALSKEEVPPTIRSGIFGADIIEAFADIFRTLDSNQAVVIQDNLKGILRNEKFAFRLQANAAALLIATLVRNDTNPQPISISNISAGDVRVFDELSPANITNVNINYFDARSTDLTKVTFKETTINSLVVNDSSKFGYSIPDIKWLELHKLDSKQSERIYSPERINAWFVCHSQNKSTTSQFSNPDEYPLIKLLDRLCRRFMRQHQIREHERDDAGILLRDPLWPILREILEQEKILISSVKNNISGRPDTFYYMHSPEALLSPGKNTLFAIVRDKLIQKSQELNKIKQN